MLLRGRKITQLLEQFAKAETNKDELQLISELRQFDKSALRKSIKAIQQRKLEPEKAEILLDKLCDDSSVQDIVPLISSTNNEVSKLAKNVILKRMRKPALPLLIAYLDGPDPNAKNNAIDVLLSLQDESCVPELISKYRSGDDSVKLGVLRILSKTGGTAAKTQIISALNDESVQVSVAAAKIMEKMNDPDNTEPLIQRLTSKDPQVKRTIIKTLGNLGDKRASLPLLNLLKDNDMVVRQEAVDSILKISDAGIVPDIMKLIGDEDVNVRRCAVEVLNKLNDPRASEALIQAIKDSDWWVRQIATDTLATLKGDIIVKSFIALAHDEDVNLRRCVVEFFNLVPDKSTFETLLELLKDEDWWVRDKTVMALGKLKDARAIAPLEEMIDDEETKGTVPSALAEIGGIGVLKPLRKFLREDQKRVRLATVKALGQLKVKEVIPDLKECLGSPDDDIRSEAIKALKELTGRIFQSQDARIAGQSSRAAMSKEAPLTEGIVVLDVCNSTDISVRYGDNFALNLLQTLNDLVAPIAQREDFQFLKSTGDGFLVTFPKVNNSVRFALEVLAELDKYNSNVDKAAQINLRLAINFGETRTDEMGDRHGTAVNMAFRVEGVKPGDIIPVEHGMAKEELPLDNRILVTENVVKELTDLREVKARLVGLFDLKGITGLHKIFQLTPIKRIRM